MLRRGGVRGFIGISSWPPRFQDEGCAGRDAEGFAGDTETPAAAVDDDDELKDGRWGGRGRGTVQKGGVMLRGSDPI